MKALFVFEKKKSSWTSFLWFPIATFVASFNSKKKTEPMYWFYKRLY